MLPSRGGFTSSSISPAPPLKRDLSSANRHIRFPPARSIIQEDARRQTVHPRLSYYLDLWFQHTINVRCMCLKASSDTRNVKFLLFSSRPGSNTPSLPHRDTQGSHLESWCLWGSSGPTASGSPRSWTSTLSCWKCEAWFWPLRERGSGGKKGQEWWWCVHVSVLTCVCDTHLWRFVWRWCSPSPERKSKGRKETMISNSNICGAHDETED